MNRAHLGLCVALSVLGLAATTARAEKATGYVAGSKTTLRITEVEGKDVEIKTAKAFRVMAKAASKKGVDLRIRSGFRTFAKQERLYKQYRRGDGNLAAPPGYSNHESGRALDLYVTDHKAFDWLQEHAHTYGFHRTVPGEAWHWEYLGDEDKDAISRPERPSRKAHKKSQPKHDS
ncbi:MAG TPA: D-alanyl-D-alanine carboxypeptidase family protein [Kofleriaceae bacterium]|nr:D-alanyl-D-alanine carboxypeptidase family protein [Kofleriaceae bacterium]